MNQPDDGSPVPRWTGEVAAASERTLTAGERTVIAEVLAGMRRLRHGVIHLSIQDGKVVQIETTEKKRL